MEAHRFPVSSPESVCLDGTTSDPMDPSLTLSTLLSSVLGSVDDDLPPGLNNEEFSFLRGPPLPIFDEASPQSGLSDLETPDRASPQENPIHPRLSSLDFASTFPPFQGIPWNDGYSSSPDAGTPTFCERGGLLEEVPATSSSSSFISGAGDLPPFSEVLRPPDKFDPPCDDVIVPWTAPVEIPPRLPQGPFGILGPTPSQDGEAVGGCYFGAPLPHHIQASKRLEHLVSFKVGNPSSDASPPGAYSSKTQPNALGPEPLPPIQQYPVHQTPAAIPFPETGVMQNYSQCARIWGLTVEQWQTQQTTFRYFPSHCDGSYWPGWSFEMPSSGENSPVPDPLGGLGGFDMSPSSVGGGGPSPHKMSAGAGKLLEGKRCGVCGDRALGYNFNAITCESCKAFFRRNALKNKEYRCPFNDQCEVTSVTRRFCQRCRLRKCFEVGMKKEWIMSEEEKKKKRKKIEENRARKLGDMESSSLSSSPSSPSGGGNYGASVGITSSAEEGNPMQLITSPSFTLHRPVCGVEEEEGRFVSGGSAPVADLPSLSLKSPPSEPPPSKPKAVVVGRVRVEEKELKVRKIVAQSDVHTPKSMKPNVPSITQPKPIPLTPIGEDASHPPSPLRIQASESRHTAPFQPPPLSAQSHFPSHSQQHYFSCNDSPMDSLVMGLLRTHSHGSAEQNTPMSFSPPPLGCQIEEKQLHIPSVIVKREKEEDSEREADLRVLYENSNSPLGPGDSACQHPHSSRGVAQDKMELWTPPRDNVSRFDFSIHEALSLIQPGCRDTKWSSSTFLPSSSGNNVIESIMNTAISAEYSAFSLLANSSSDLNQAETIKITELLEASKGLNSPLCEEPNYKDSPNPSLINVINLTEIAIRRLIKMAKKISAFKMFCQEDQIALLKGGCTEMMILRSVSAYDSDKEVWKIQQDYERFKDIKLKVLKAAPGNVYEEHKRFILSFEPRWRNDTRIIALLAAIALFTPERPNIIHTDAVRHEQSSYLYLLKRYMECTYGGCLGKTYYIKLLEIIGNLHILNEDHVRVFLEVNPQEVEPLLIEIFDLKQS